MLSNKIHLKKWHLVSLYATTLFVGISFATSYLIDGKSQTAFPEDGVLDVGVVTTQYNRKKEYEDLQKYLQSQLIEELDREVTVKLHSIDWTKKDAFTEAKQKLKAQEWDLVFANGALVSTAAAIDYNYQPVARMFPQVPQIESVLFVRADSPIKNLADLNANTKLALGEVNFAAGFTMPIYKLKGERIHLDFGNTPEEIIEKVVISGEADVGAGVYQRFNNKRSKELNNKVRIIYRDRGIPLSSVFVSPQFTQEQVDLVQQILVNAPPEIKQQARYGEGNTINYQEFKKIQNKVDKLLKCSDWTQKPARLWCDGEETPISPVSYPPGSIVGKVFADINEDSETITFKLQGKDGINYKIILPTKIWQEDPQLPASSTEIYGKTLQISEDVEKTEKLGITELKITKTGQITIIWGQ